MLREQQQHQVGTYRGGADTGKGGSGRTGRDAAFALPPALRYLSRVCRLMLLSNNGTEIEEEGASKHQRERLLFTSRPPIRGIAVAAAATGRINERRLRRGPEFGNCNTGGCVNN